MSSIPVILTSFLFEDNPLTMLTCDLFTPTASEDQLYQLLVCRPSTGGAVSFTFRISFSMVPMICFFEERGSTLTSMVTPLLIFLNGIFISYIFFGSRRVNVEPSPGLLFTSIRPPITCSCSFTIAKPESEPIGAGSAIKAAEDAVQYFLLHPGPGVFHTDIKHVTVVTVVTVVDADTARRGVPYRIRKDVLKDTFEFVRVGTRMEVAPPRDT